MSETKAGGKVRFRVGGEFGVGSSWALETMKKTGDVYLYHREGAKRVKTSLHDSGQWHYKYMPGGMPDVQPEYLAVTKEHTELAPGWTRAAAIIVPNSELRRNYVESVANKGTVDVPISHGHNATEITVLLKAPGATSKVLVQDAFMIGSIHRGDGGHVHLYAQGVTLPASPHDVFAEVIADAKKCLLEQQWDGAVDTRIVLCGRNDEGVLQQFEIAIDRLPQGGQSKG